MRAGMRGRRPRLDEERVERLAPAGLQRSDDGRPSEHSVAPQHALR